MASVIKVTGTVDVGDAVIADEEREKVVGEEEAEEEEDEEAEEKGKALRTNGLMRRVPIKSAKQPRITRLHDSLCWANCMTTRMYCGLYFSGRVKM